jgi:Aldehyde dehydrogenase family
VCCNLRHYCEALPLSLHGTDTLEYQLSCSTSKLLFEHLLCRSLQLFMSGKFVDAHGGATTATVNPHTGKPVANVAAAQAADVDAAVCAARQAYDSGPWPRMTGKVHLPPVTLPSAQPA